jgi:DNA-directed RNA polymerase alpha subunit
MLVMVNFNKFLTTWSRYHNWESIKKSAFRRFGCIAISAVRIAGVTHEFSTIPGVREDILEILLNLKGIVVKNKTQDIEFGRLKVQGPSVITADLIQLPSNLEIVNPNHYTTIYLKHS